MLTAEELLRRPKPFYTSARAKPTPKNGTSARVWACFELHPNGLFTADIARMTGIECKKVSCAVSDFREKLEVVGTKGLAKKWAVKGRR
jgi:hypothetical protein